MSDCPQEKWVNVRFQKLRIQLTVLRTSSPQKENFQERRPESDSCPQEHYVKGKCSN